MVVLATIWKDFILIGTHRLCGRGKTYLQNAGLPTTKLLEVAVAFSHVWTWVYMAILMLAGEALGRDTTIWEGVRVAHPARVQAT